MDIWSETTSQSTSRMRAAPTPTAKRDPVGEGAVSSRSRAGRPDGRSPPERAPTHNPRRPLPWEAAPRPNCQVRSRGRMARIPPQAAAGAARAPRRAAERRSRRTTPLRAPQTVPEPAPGCQHHTGQTDREEGRHGGGKVRDRRTHGHRGVARSSGPVEVVPHQSANVRDRGDVSDEKYRQRAAGHQISPTTIAPRWPTSNGTRRSSMSAALLPPWGASRPCGSSVGATLLTT